MSHGSRTLGGVLHSHRKRQRELAEAEAAGKSFWTEAFEETARLRLAAAVTLHMRHRPPDVAEGVSLLFRTQLGLDIGFSGHMGNLQDYVEKRCPDDLMPSLCEAIMWCVSRTEHDADVLETTINHILNDHRISFELIDGKMIEFESKELHQEVVAPTLRLLSGRSGWDTVEKVYQTALGEISQNNAADAITDAGTALQEALQLLGCVGNALGPLIKSATKKGLLTPYDVKLADWVSADRSEMGDSHKAGSSATREDAWLTVHVVGALILHLAGGPARGAGSA